MEFGRIHVDIVGGFEKFQSLKVKSFKDFLVEKFNYQVLDEDDNEGPSSKDIKASYQREVDARVKVNRNLLWITARKGFFAQLLAKLNIYGSSDPRYTTMCTNGFNIQYHPDFVLSQTDSAIRFVLCHEILHCVGDHMSRRGSRDPLLWNYACDYAINPILNVEIVGGQFEWPQNSDGTRMGLYEEKYEGMKAEDIYDLLVDDQEQQQKAEGAFKDDPDKGMHVVDADQNLGNPDGDQSIVQDVSDQEGEESPGSGKPQPGGENKPQPGEGQPGGGGGEEGEEGEGKSETNIVGKRVRITSGPNAGQIGVVKQVLPNGDIIID